MLIENKDDFDSNEWGNIELPGFEDSKLLNPNLNIALSNKDKGKNPAIKQKQSNSMKQLIKTESYTTAFEKGMEVRNASVSWKENVGIGSRKRSANPEYQKTIKQALRESNSKAIMTPEGKFEVTSDAARHYFDNKLTQRSTLGSVEKWIRCLIKKPDSGFYLLEGQ